MLWFFPPSRFVEQLPANRDDRSASLQRIPCSNPSQDRSSARNDFWLALITGVFIEESDNNPIGSHACVDGLE